MTTWTVTDTGNAVTNGTNFQSILTGSATFGDTIVLIAGATYTGVNFLVPYLGAGTGTDADYITVTTSNTAGITADGVRIEKANVTAMPKLMASSSYPVLEFVQYSHHYKFIGIEFTNVGGSIVCEEQIIIGGRSSGAGATFVEQPHHITFDRCWIHEATNDTTTPDSTTTSSIRGMAVNGTDITIKECRIAGFRAYRPTPAGVEASHGIFFPNAALRCDVTNCYIEAWFTCLFFGGSGGTSPNTATLTSPTFDSGTHTGSATFSNISNLAVGDLVAFKVTGGTCPIGSAHSGEAVAFQIAKVTGIVGSVVSYLSWGSYEGALTGGNPLLQTPDAAGPVQWNGYLNQDINIRRNELVLNFNSTETVWTSTGGDPTTLRRVTQTNTGNGPKGFIEIKMGRNILIEGNTFDGWSNGIVLTTRNQGGGATSGGFPWFGLFNVTIQHNWWKRMANWDRIYGFPIGGPFLEDNEYTTAHSGPVTLHNNLIESGVEMIFANLGGCTSAICTHNTFPGDPLPPGRSMILCAGSHVDSLTFKDNILSNNEAGVNDQSGMSGGAITSSTQNHNVIIDNRSAPSIANDPPLTTRYPDDFIASTHAAVGWTDEAGGNFRLASSSTYKNAASDGTDPGVNYTTLLAALGGTTTVRGSRVGFFIL